MNPGTLFVLIVAALIALCFAIEWVWFEIKWRRVDRKRKARRREQEAFAEWWTTPAREPRRRV